MPATTQDDKKMDRDLFWSAFGYIRILRDCKSTKENLSVIWVSYCIETRETWLTRMTSRTGTIGRRRIQAKVSSDSCHKAMGNRPKSVRNEVRCVYCIVDSVFLHQPQDQRYPPGCWNPKPLESNCRLFDASHSADLDRVEVLQCRRSGSGMKFWSSGGCWPSEDTWSRRLFSVVVLTPRPINNNNQQNILPAVLQLQPHIHLFFLI